MAEDFSATIKKITRHPILSPRRYLKKKIYKIKLHKHEKPTLLSLVAANNLKVKGIIHVGSNSGQEIDQYLKFGDVPVFWIDPIKNLLDILDLKIRKLDLRNHRTIEACCSDVSNEKLRG